MFLQVTVTRTSALSNDIGIWKDGCIEILEVGFDFKVELTQF